MLLLVSSAALLFAFMLRARLAQVFVLAAALQAYIHPPMLHRGRTRYLMLAKAAVGPLVCCFRLAAVLAVIGSRRLAMPTFPPLTARSVTFR